MGITLQMRKFARIVSVIAATGAFASVIGAQPTQLAMLDGLERGGWELAFRNDDGGKERVCLATGRELIQLRHAGLKCKSTVVSDSPQEVTVQYSCPGQGYGRTNIRRESNRLVQIDAQGIESGLPFAFAAEARWVGSCRR